MYKVSRYPILLGCMLAAAPAASQLTPGELPTEAQVQAGEVKNANVPAGAEPVQAAPVALPPGRWTKETASELLAYVEQVGVEGLNPADYAPARLRAAIEGGDENAMRTVATDVFMRLSGDLSLGHVRGDARVSWHLEDNDLNGNDQYALMTRAIENGSVRDSLSSLLPTHPQYTELKGVLASTDDPAVKAKVRTNLDRWRWLPRDLGQRYVIVNVPAYTVALVEDGQVVARHRAVVGAPKTATPSLSAVATGVIFNPWWEVPKSIANEVRGKKGYVTVKAGDGVRYRQPPGPGNSLGRMKVVMPNNYAIYLHDTPSKSLFKKEARAFSHGCIRTQDALGFAQTLLANPQWDKAAIDQAIAEGKTVKADATVPTPVYITYFTAAAAKDGGGIVSYNDIYGRDKTVMAALDTGDSNMALASR